VRIEVYKKKEKKRKGVQVKKREEGADSAHLLFVPRFGKFPRGHLLDKMIILYIGN
jgi:hypothetical protein